MAEATFCASCGEAVAEADAFCASCGAAQSVTADPLATIQPSQLKREEPMTFVAPPPPAPRPPSARTPLDDRPAAGAQPQGAEATRTPWSGLDMTIVALTLVLGAALLAIPWYEILPLTAVEQPKGWTAIMGVVAAVVVILSVLTARTTQGGRVVGWLGSLAALASVVLKYALPQLEYANEVQVNSVILQAYGTGFWMALGAGVLLVLLGTVRLFKRPPAW
jgi:hypothetical protein